MYVFSFCLLSSILCTNSVSNKPNPRFCCRCLEPANQSHAEVSRSRRSDISENNNSWTGKEEIPITSWTMRRFLDLWSQNLIQRWRIKAMILSSRSQHTKPSRQKGKVTRLDMEWSLSEIHRKNWTRLQLSTTRPPNGPRSGTVYDREPSPTPEGPNPRLQCPGGSFSNEEKYGPSFYPRSVLAFVAWNFLTV